LHSPPEYVPYRAKMSEPLPPPQACVFDVDGTLLDSLRDIAESLNHCLDLLGLPAYPIADYRYMVGEGIPKLCQRAVGPTHPTARKNESPLPPRWSPEVPSPREGASPRRFGPVPGHGPPARHAGYAQAYANIGQTPRHGSQRFLFHQKGPPPHARIPPMARTGYSGPYTKITKSHPGCKSKYIFCVWTTATPPGHRMRAAGTGVRKGKGHIQGRQASPVAGYSLPLWLERKRIRKGAMLNPKSRRNWFSRYLA